MTRAAAQQLSAIQGNFPNFTTQLSQCDRQSERWLRLINEVLMIQLVKRCYVFKGSLPHLPSSFSSKTGLLEELLAPILFFHLPQWNIDDQIAFLASWRETTALCWTRSSNDRKHNHTFHPPQIKNIQAPLLRFIYPIFVRPTTRLKSRRESGLQNKSLTHRLDCGIFHTETHCCYSWR